MNLIIVHYHLRPGGIRRVVELATPYLVEAGGGAVERIVLAVGEASYSLTFNQRLTLILNMAKHTR